MEESFIFREAVRQTIQAAIDTVSYLAIEVGASRDIQAEVLVINKTLIKKQNCS